jgi:hypothetical protein
MSGIHQVIVYSRKGCHLCEIVKEQLLKLSRRGTFTWQEVDINGRKAFKYHMDEQEFLKKLSA